MNKIVTVLAAGFSALVLAGCATTGAGLSKDGLAAPNASQAKPPVILQTDEPVLAALTCFANAWPNRDNYIFGVDTTYNGTGKATLSGEGATGEYLPKDASPFIIQGLYDAGLRVHDLTNFATMGNLVKFSGDYGLHTFTTGLAGNLPDALVTGKVVTGDFTGSSNIDLMIGPVGPIGQTQGFVTTTAVSINDSITGEVLGQSLLRQYVSYSSLGVGVAGIKDGTLITGGLSVSDQQQLQFENSNKPMLVGTVHALSLSTVKLARNDNRYNSPEILACRAQTQALLHRF